MQRAGTIGAMTVLDETGASVRLDTLWRHHISSGPGDNATAAEIIAANRTAA